MPSTIPSAPFITVVNDLLDSKGWSQSELGKKSGLSNAQLSRLLAGKNKRVRQATVDKIASAFELSTSEFSSLLSSQSEDKVLSKQSRKADIRIDRLPTVSGEFIGREAELKLLDNALSDGDIHIVQLVAAGGAGKTKLLRHWLNQNTDKLQNYIIWSFYSQGAAEDKQISATPFFNEALRACYAEKTYFSSEEERGDYLAELLVENRCLLVLDGLEPLQHAGKGASGRLKDRALARLLKNLASRHSSLCIITTRLRVHDISDRAHVIDYSLDNLEPEDGVALLQSLGVKGTADDLKQAVQEYSGHALALHLLGNALTTYLDGDVQKRDTLDELLDDYDEQGRHAFRIMQAYQYWLTDENDQPTVELQFLYILGLFDHPVEANVLQALWEKQIPGLTGGIPQKAWQIAQRDLREKHRLLSVHEERPDLLDCHPLIREYFGRQLREQNPDVWQAAHSCLYEYYKGVPEKELPDTLEEMQPLFLAVAHGCKAGLYQEAFDEVYWPRIQRYQAHYTIRKLGAFSDELAVIAHFFAVQWSAPHINFAEEYRNALFYSASMSLNALGRLQEAFEPAEQTLDILIKQEDWKSAAQFAHHLSLLKLTLGNLNEAISIARQSIEYADQANDDFQKAVCYTTCANALHQHGELEKAHSLFKKAEEIHEIKDTNIPYFHSIWGYCELLVDQHDIDNILEKIEQTFKWTGGKNPTNVTTITLALNHLYFGKIRVLRGEITKASKMFEEAVDQLRRSGRKDMLPLGLLSRAALFCKTNDFSKAHQDLQEVYEIAEPSGMRLYLTDYHLEMARLFLKQWQQHLLDESIQTEIQKHIDSAIKLIEETGYHRRDAEVQALIGPVQAAAVDNQAEWSEEW